jgi:hypothetical protein
MKVKNILKDRNKDSPESTLKVKYIVNYGNVKTQKSVKLNPFLFKSNLLAPKINYKISELRKEHFNSYSNENMDFFRLDHLFEYDRDNYHNKFMDDIKPINRKENFQKFNEMREKIKYLDYLKQNFLLSQNKIINEKIMSNKDIEISKRREKYYAHKIQSNNNDIYLVDKKIKNDNIIKYNYSESNIMNNNLNTINYDHSYRKEIAKSNSSLSINNNNLNINNGDLNSNKNGLQKSLLNLYLPNIQKFSIKDAGIKLYNDRSKIQIFQTNPNDSSKRNNNRNRFNQEKYKDLLNNNPFSIAYNDNKKDGFLKKNGIFSNYNKVYKKNKIPDLRTKKYLKVNIRNSMNNMNDTFNKTHIYTQTFENDFFRKKL